MKMTHLLVGSSLATGSNEQQQLRQFAAALVGKIVTRAEMLSEEDRLELDRMEQHVTHANRMMMDRSFEAPVNRDQQEAFEL